MRTSLPHVVSKGLSALLVPLVLAACDPTWQGRAPVNRPVAGHSGCGAAITVQPGETVYSISRRCNVSVRELIEANHLQAPYGLAAGMVLRMPGGSGEYVVQRGDTLLVVARRLKVDFQTLARINNKSAPHTIYVGEKLKVPGAYGEQVAVAAPTQGRGGHETLVVTSPNAAGGQGRASKSSTQIASTLPAPAPAPAEAPAPASPQRHPAFQPQQPLPQTPPPMAGRGFIWPVRGEVLSEFGPIAKGQNNDGINIAAPRGTPIKAVENGVVAYVGNELKGFGNLVLVKHADGWISAYAHADQLMVRKGDQVRRGQTIASVGSSGSVSSPQLHFELRRGTEAVNPADHLRGDA
ncbi:LysM peptidoglycan-binding domain-containing M23 family metallopeptidase [Magnetospirillum moscoviense]|uniref:LysM peptidoglycan-binding domain-containing M23 family metallopeptidase n=1 Tax=Magnetospirillum moscoviense TaxID=1437059 RepID=UPI00083969BD|nr:LysM peptidoglycan-binding domain-containing M23 family metallopeptidase [Magnetospirillum moscoviense]